MAESIGALSVDLRLLSAKFEQGVNGVNKRLDNLGSQANRVNKIFGSLLAVGGGAAFSGLIKGSIDSANRLGDLSNRLGVSVEGLSRLEYAARLTGVSQTVLATGLQRAQRRIAEAAQGTGEAVKALDELGLSAEKLNQLKPEEQFQVLADALESVPKQSDKVRLAMKLLDSEGVALLQTMKGGSAAIREMGEESDRTGNTVSTELAQSATAANAAMIKFGGTMTGITNTMIASLGPGLQETAEWFSSVLPNALSFSSRAFNGIRAVIAYLSARLVELGRVVTSVAGMFSDDFAAVDRTLAAIQDSLDQTSQDFANRVNETANEQERFNVVLQKSNLSLQDYIGSTQSATDALQDQKKATQEIARIEKQRQETASKFESIRESLRSETQVEIEEHAARLAAIEEFRLLDVNNEVKANLVLENEKARHEAALSEIEKTESEKRKALIEQERNAKISLYQSLFSNLSVLMNSKSKKLFEIGKKAAIASAVVNTAKGIMEAWAMGPIMGPIGAAAVAAAGATQIQNIKSQQFGGGGTVNAGTSGGGLPNTYNPPQPLIPAAPEVDSTRHINVIFNGNLNGDPQYLAESIKEWAQKADFQYT